MSIALDLFELSSKQYTHSKNQGFWDIDRDGTGGGMDPFDLLMGTKLGLMSTEVAEATEEYRVNGATAHFGEELADIVIRVMDVAGMASIDLNKAILAKMEKNATRPYRHGKRF